MLRLLVTAALVAPTSADPYEEIRVLDAAASFELEATRGRCERRPDLAAASAAGRAAQIHQTRIGLARRIAAGDPGAHSPEEWIPLAFQAADAFERQFLCAGAIEPLQAARDLLAGLRAELTDPSSPGAQALDRRLAEIDARRAAARPVRPAGPAEATTVRIVVLDGHVSPGPRDSRLGRLALRLELGANFVRAGDPPSYFYHRGPNGRLSLLARHHVSERARVHLLFGPYYGFSRVSDPERPDGAAWHAGPMSLHRVGGQFEVQWAPSARLKRWLSLNPALELGLELGDYHGRGAGQAAGFQVGGGLSLCIWQQSVCPGARALATPLRRGHAVAAAQVGLAIDILRLAELGLTASDRRRRAP